MLHGDSRWKRTEGFKDGGKKEKNKEGKEEATQNIFIIKWKPCKLNKTELTDSITDYDSKHNIFFFFWRPFLTYRGTSKRSHTD